MPKTNSLQHVYFVPGMAANPTIFENIALSKDHFEVHYITWLIPEKSETMRSYAQRMCDCIEHKNSVLIGVSFGGVVVQEMAKLMNFKRVIIISSVKTKYELPKRMKRVRKTGIYKILPTGMVNYIHHLEKLPLKGLVKRRISLYKTYLSISDKRYLDWAIKNMVCWDQTEVMKNVIHIHGNKDIVFPIEYIKNPIVVEGGTHIMVLDKYRWFNKNLPQLIEQGNLPNTNNI